VELDRPQSTNGQPVSPGDVVADKYRIERVLGVGGMGFVMAARHMTLDQAVAIKFLIPRSNAEAATERFEREARASARIESDHVCRVFDTGTLPNGIPFMVMEYLDGHDLEVELEGRSGLPVPQAVDYVLQALDAVAAAHAIGIVHRDLKPANLFLTVRADYSRRLKVLDFGISKMLSDSSITDTKGIVGTPAYMSPEQAKNSRKTDLRTDIWSMGAIMYELFSGQPPYVGETVGEVLALVLNESPRPLRELAPNLPPGMLAIVDKCLARDREDRYESAGQLARALAPFAGNAAFTTLPQSTSNITANAASQTVQRRGGDLRPSDAYKDAETVAGWTEGDGRVPDKRMRSVAAGAAATVAALAITALALGLRARDHQAGSATQAPSSFAVAARSAPPPAPAPPSPIPLPSGAALALPPVAPAPKKLPVVTNAKPVSSAHKPSGKNPLLESRD
jgi:serine/threonine-protein kinase